MWRSLRRETVTYNGVTISLAPQIVSSSELQIEIGGHPFMVLAARLKHPSPHCVWRWQLMDSPGVSAARAVFERADAGIIHRFRKNGQAPTEHQAKRAAEAVIFGLAAMSQRCARYLRAQEQFDEMTRQLIAARYELQNNLPHAWFLAAERKKWESANKPDPARRTMPPEVEAACKAENARIARELQQAKARAAAQDAEDFKSIPPPAPRRNPGDPAGE